jgi:hypothetical protein
MNDMTKIVLAIMVLAVIFLAMLVTPTLITVSGSVSVPVGMTPNGTIIQLYNESNVLVGQAVVGDSGVFRVVSSRKVAGAYKIVASNGDAARTVQVGLGYGDNPIGVMALERV